MNQNFHSEIMSRLAEKQHRQDVQVVAQMPSLYEVQDYVMLGSFSWYYQQAKKRTLLRPFAMLFPEVVATPSDLVRSYLDIKYPKLRAMRKQIAAWNVSYNQPLYAQPRTTERGVYVDLKSAYWSIVQVIGWDVDYFPNQWLGRGKSMEDFPYPDFKLTRNCLVTAGLVNDRSVWNGYNQTYETARMGNAHVNNGLWRLSMDVLQGIAADAIGSGAFYVHTDGYIVDTGNLDRLQEAIAAWGLQSTIKAAGHTIVHGVGSYSVGEKDTKQPKGKPHFFDGVVNLPYHAWLRKRFKFFADRTDFRWTSEFDKSKLKSENHSISRQEE